MMELYIFLAIVAAAVIIVAIATKGEKSNGSAGPGYPTHNTPIEPPVETEEK